MAPSGNPIRKLLVLLESGRVDAALREKLSQLGQVHDVDSRRDALDALMHERFDLSATDADQTRPMDQVGGIDPGEADRILESLGQGVCILAPDGTILWSNAKMRTFPEELFTELSNSSEKLFSNFGSGATEAPPHVRMRRFSISVRRTHHYEVTATPVPADDGKVHYIAAVVWDATNARRLQRKIDAIDKAGRALVRLDTDETDLLTVPQRLELLEKRIMSYTRELMSFDNFAIRLLDEETNKLELVLSSGLSDEGKNITIYADGEGNGISGYVAATGRSYICSDISEDRRYLPGISDARSSLTVPLRMHDQVVGVFNVENRKTNAFNEDDRQIAEIFGRYVAIALHILDLLVSERYTTKGQLADDVSAHLAGPLNDILAEATAILDKYISDEELGQRLRSICDNITKIKEHVKQVAQPAERHLLDVPDRPKVDPDLQGRTVLVADDEPVIRETITEILSGCGCQVETAREGSETIAMIEQRSYDLVLSDIRMPHASGYDVFAAAKAKNSDCPVILMTGFGYDPNHSIIQASKEGLAAVLYKPFKVDQLISEIRNALTASAPER